MFSSRVLAALGINRFEGFFHSLVDPPLLVFSSQLFSHIVCATGHVNCSSRITWLFKPLIKHRDISELGRIFEIGQEILHGFFSLA